MSVATSHFSSPTMPLSEPNLRLWNGFGLVSTNGVVTLSMDVLERLLTEARRQGFNLARQTISTTPDFGGEARNEAPPQRVGT